jgi:hypothetical protein
MPIPTRDSSVAAKSQVQSNRAVSLETDPYPDPCGIVRDADAVIFVAIVVVILVERRLGS